MICREKERRDCGKGMREGDKAEGEEGVGDHSRGILGSELTGPGLTGLKLTKREGQNIGQGIRMKAGIEFTFRRVYTGIRRPSPYSHTVQCGLKPHVSS